ncbi:MAG: 2Fe-2S iron-sulfur cluster binding domain-containing protein, partial [Anaerolineae bacterium]|nr:2Fe-2S iron-sulfur cluster binding domain-containing protein [Anaerolineae bacterium]
MNKVDFEPIGKRVSVSPDTSILDAARQAGIELTSICGGEGQCGQCRIQVLAGQVSPPNLDEEFMFTELEIQNGERLACCTYPLSDVKLHLPKSSLLTNSRLQIDSSIRDVPVDPIITRFAVEVPAPSLEDPRSDVERIVSAVVAQANRNSFFAKPEVIRQISPVARHYKWQFSVYVREHELIGI